MRLNKKKIIDFAGGSYTHLELEKKCTPKILIHLLMEQLSLSDAEKYEWEQSQRRVATVEKELEDVDGQRGDLHKILHNLETVIQFMLDTKYPNQSSYNINQGYTEPDPDREVSEEEHILRKLLAMTTDVNFQRNYGDELGMPRRS